jgi:uncharacterized protein YcbX
VTGREVGRVAALWRYPVKSMAAEPLDEVEVAWHGLAGDRRWGFIRPGLERSGFPWLTMRERPELALYRPRLLRPDQPDASPTVVRTPAGDEMDVADPALAAELGDGVRVMRQHRGVFDAAPLSMIGAGTVERLSDLVGTELDVRRFRPNIVVATVGGVAYAEERWVGEVLRIGEALVRVDRHDRRCVMVNVDPDTGQRERTVLATIARERRNELGVYATPVHPGRLAVGDPVVLTA